MTTRKPDDPKAAAQATAPSVSPAATFAFGTTSIANAASVYLSRLGLAVLVDNRIGGPASTQSTATPLPADFTRVTQGVANASFILPAIGRGEVRSAKCVVNDSGVSIIVYAAQGESLNGTTNGSITIPNGQNVGFDPVFPEIGAPDWRTGTYS
jgi:hypothetical protein